MKDPFYVSGSEEGVPQNVNNLDNEIETQNEQYQWIPTRSQIRFDKMILMLGGYSTKFVDQYSPFSYLYLNQFGNYCIGTSSGKKQIGHLLIEPGRTDITLLDQIESSKSKSCGSHSGQWLFNRNSSADFDDSSDYDTSAKGIRWHIKMERQLKPVAPYNTPVYFTMNDAFVMGWWPNGDLPIASSRFHYFFFGTLSKIPGQVTGVVVSQGRGAPGFFIARREKTGPKGSITFKWSEFTQTAEVHPVVYRKFVVTDEILPQLLYATPDSELELLANDSSSQIDMNFLRGADKIITRAHNLPNSVMSSPGFGLWEKITLKKDAIEIASKMLSPVTSSPYSWVGKYKSATIKIGPKNIVYHNYQKNSPGCEIGIWNVSTSAKTLRYDPNMCGPQSMCSKLPSDFTSDIGTDLKYLTNWNSSNPNAFGYRSAVSGRAHYWYKDTTHSSYRYTSEVWMSPSRC
jgi:hypothetical protein